VSRADVPAASGAAATDAIGDRLSFQQ